MGNGMPIAALVGREEWMRHMPSINYGMVYEGESVSIAAALATLLEILEHNVPAALARKGAALKAEHERLARAHGVAVEIVGPDACPHLVVADQGGVPGRALRLLALQEMASRGVFTLGAFVWCHAHTDADLEAIVEALDAALAGVARAAERGTVEGMLDPRLLQKMGGVHAPATWRNLRQEEAEPAPPPKRAAAVPDGHHLELAQAEGILLTALARCRGGDTESAHRLMRSALTRDPGIDPGAFPDGDPVPPLLERIVTGTRSPATLSALANIELVFGRRAAAVALFDGYLRLAPEATDRDAVARVLGQLRSASPHR